MEPIEILVTAQIVFSAVLGVIAALLLIKNARLRNTVDFLMMRRAILERMVELTGLIDIERFQKDLYTTCPHASLHDWEGYAAMVSEEEERQYRFYKDGVIDEQQMKDNIQKAKELYRARYLTFRPTTVAVSIPRKGVVLVLHAVVCDRCTQEGFDPVREYSFLLAPAKKEAT